MKRRKGINPEVLRVTTHVSNMIGRELTAKEWAQVGLIVKNYPIDFIIESLNKVHKKMRDGNLEIAAWIPYLYGILKNKPLDKEEAEKQLTDILSDLS